MFRAACVVMACVVLTLLPSFAHSAGSAHVPVGSRVYRSLERLEALGFIESALLSSRPITRDEARRIKGEAQQAISSAGNGAAYEIDRLEDALYDEALRDDTYLDALEDASFKYVYSEDASHADGYNNNGDDLGNGAYLRASIGASARYAGYLGGYIRPELRVPESATDDEASIELLEGYGSLTLGNFELTAGREALWWGPGYHGALLVSNNAKAFDQVRASNPEPFEVPVIGRLKYTFFLTRLESDRDFPNAYLAGMRLDIKPSRHVDVGLSRTAMFGGEGRDLDLSTILDVFTTNNENTGEEAGNQLASIDLKITAPNGIQPFVVYGELGGEDEAGYLPSRIAYIAGVYLPRLPFSDAMDLRVEYANTHVDNHPDVWYNHHLYSTGYAYDGSVIGHHMGTDAKDLFIEAAYYADALGDLRVSYDAEAQNLSDAVRTRIKTVQAAWEDYFGPLGVRLAYSYTRVNDEGGVAGQDSEAHSLGVTAQYGF